MSKQAENILKSLDCLSAYQIYLDKPQNGYTDNDKKIVVSMVENLIHFNNFTEKQEKFIKFLLKKIASKEQYGESNPSCKLVAGKHTFLATVKSFKKYETPYGTQEKMLLETENGLKVFGNVPKKFTGSIGIKLEITANFKPSESDSGFGFFTYPTIKIIAPDF